MDNLFRRAKPSVMKDLGALRERDPLDKVFHRRKRGLGVGCWAGVEEVEFEAAVLGMLVLGEAEDGVDS